MEIGGSVKPGDGKGVGDVGEGVGEDEPVGDGLGVSEVGVGERVGERRTGGGWAGRLGSWSGGNSRRRRTGRRRGRSWGRCRVDDHLNCTVGTAG